MVANMADLIHLQASNKIVLYSDTLASQIPTSYAANAYRIFTSNMLKSAVSKICTFWDGPAADRNSVPSVIKLVDNPDVMAELRRRRMETRVRGRSLTAQNDDRELLAWLEDMSNRENAKRADDVDAELADAIRALPALLSNDRLLGARDFRDRYLSHSLAEETKRNTTRNAQYGDEEYLIELTLPFINTLNLAVRDSSYDWQGTSEIAEKNALALWNGCKFDVVE
jgi:hypothetical protein